MNRMQITKKRLVLGLCLMTALTFLSGCSSAPSPEQQRSMVPYRLSGSKDGWEISCDVREMTAKEKRTLMDTLEQDWAKEEALLSASEISQEDHAKLKEAQEEMLRDLEEKEAYISSISVLCSDRELEGKTVTYQLKGENNEKLVAGTQIVFPETSLWYSSWQTEGDLFIPPAETAAMVIDTGAETISIPLRLSVQ